VLDLSEAVVIKVVDLRLRLDEARGNGSSSGRFAWPSLAMGVRVKVETPAAVMAYGRLDS
jgi:hypothetical protein